MNTNQWLRTQTPNVEWIKELQQQNSLHLALKFFVKTTSLPLLYLELSPSLLILKHSNISKKSIAPYFFRLKEGHLFSHPNQVLKLKQNMAFHHHITKLLNTAQYWIFPLTFRDKTLGVFVGQVKTEHLKNRILILNSHIKNILWHKKWEKEQTTHVESSCLKEKFFMQKLFIEFSRARRLFLPLSLIILEWDQFMELKNHYDLNATLNFFNSFAKTLIQDSRAYDIFGAWPMQGRLAIVLPHTSERGAGLKAEKLRWSAENAQFSEFFAQHDRLTLSLGLAEYPYVSRSADGLFRSALKALYFSHYKWGGNIISSATPAKGFKPDFPVKRNLNPLMDLT